MYYEEYLREILDQVGRKRPHGEHNFYVNVTKLVIQII